MKGGLLQLATLGKEDSVLISNPEISYFKKVFLKSTHFSIDNNFYNIGRKKNDTNVDIEIKKDGDLLKDIMFYIDIPFFEIEKKIETQDTTFNRTESDKIYYEHMDMKSFVYHLSDKKFYIIPESIFYYFSDNIIEEEVSYSKILDINSSEYNKYFNDNSEFVELKFNTQNFSHDSIAHLKTLDSFWFNSLITKVNNNNKTLVSLMDMQRFTNWLNGKMERFLFTNYHSRFNDNINNDKYQINFNINNRDINEVKKYFEVYDKLNVIKNNDVFTDEGLDIDKAISDLLNQDLLNQDYEMTSEDSLEYILNTIIYSSKFIKFLLNKIYDDSNDNFMTFFKMFSVSTEKDNKIVNINEKSYDKLVWANFTSKYFSTNFDFNEYDLFNSFAIKDFKISTDIIGEELNIIWNQLILYDSTNNTFKASYIFCILYTFAKRYASFSSYDTVNFLDFFTDDSDPSFITVLNECIETFSDPLQTDLESIYTLYGKKLDLTLIYNYVVYFTTDKIEKLTIFNNFTSITKQNVQFIYWWRNKIANMIFIRYKRILNNTTSDDDNFYPNFDSFKTDKELVNFFYTYIPNYCISLDEIKNDLRNVFYNKTYFGILSNDTNTDYQEIEKQTILSVETFDSSKSGIITGLMSIYIKDEEFIQNGNIITFIETCKMRNNYFNKESEFNLIYDNISYNLTIEYQNNEISLLLEEYVELSDFELLVNLKIPINKYYFDYTPLEIEKSELTFTNVSDGDYRTFTSSIDYDVEKFDFTMERSIKENDEFITLQSVDVSDNDLTYTFLLNTNYNLSVDLTTTDYTNYTKELYVENQYTNLDSTDTSTNNFTIESQIINSLEYTILTVNTDDFFTLSTSSIYYISYDSNLYYVTISEGFSDNEFILSIPSSLSNDFFDNISQTEYVLIEYLSVVSDVGQLSFVSLDSNETFINISNLDTDNVSDDDMTFISADLSDTDLTDSNFILEYDNYYYSVSISAVDESNYQYLVSDVDELVNITLSESILYVNYGFQFVISTTLTISNSYFIRYISSDIETVSEEIRIEKNLDSSGSNFDNENLTFSYLLKSLEDDEYINIIDQSLYDFKIVGRHKFTNQYQIFNDNLDFKNNKYFAFSFDSDKDYYIDLEYKDSTFVRKKIVFEETTNENEFYIINFNNYYYQMYKKIDFTLISSINIQEFIPYYNKFILEAEITIENEFVSNANVVKFKVDIVNNTNNYEMYYRYFINKLTSCYIYINELKVYLEDFSLEDDYIIFKLLNTNQINSDYELQNFDIYCYNNEYLPNLINFTSFYHLDNSNKSYDLMDYFIQTPMIIYLDDNSTKKGHVILKNIPLEIKNFDKIYYLKLNDTLLHLHDNIHSGQLIRYSTNLISSSYDDYLHFSNKNYNIIRESILKQCFTEMEKILELNMIKDVIDAMENTNDKINKLYFDYNIDKINQGYFGLTCKKLLETFNNSNIMNLLSHDTSILGNELLNSISQDKFNIFSNMNCINYDLYSKYVLDFYGDHNNNVSMDNNLGYTTSTGTGKDIFVTNYKILLNENKLNSNMLTFLENYHEEIDKHMIFIKNNKLWLNLYSSKINTSFDYFYNFQKNYRNEVYQTENNYDFKLLYTNEFSTYKELEKKYFIHNEEVVLDENNNKFNSSTEISSTRKLISSLNNKDNNSFYSKKKDKFNYLGPAMIKNKEIFNSTLNINFDDNMDYIFIDDAMNCFILERPYNDSHSFNINDSINKNYINGKVYDISNTYTTGEKINNLYIYEFNLNQDTNIQVEQFILVDNILCKIIEVNDDTFKFLSQYSLILENNIFYKGTVDESYSDISDNVILEKNLVNIINFEEETDIIIEYEFGNLIDIIELNINIDSEYVDGNLYCSLKDGLLDIYQINESYFTFITDDTFFSLGNLILSNIPLKNENKTVTCYYINNFTPENNTVFFSEKEIFELKNMPDTESPIHLWYYFGDIKNSFNELDVIIDINNKKINIELNSYDAETIYEDLKFFYFYFDKKFYNFSDFTLDTTLNGKIEQIYIINNNSFENNSIYNTVKYIQYSDTTYNLSYMNDSIDSTNTDLFIYNVPKYRYKIDNSESKTKRNTILFFKDSSSNQIINRPLQTIILDSDRLLNKLKYKIYNDSNLTEETDSIIKISSSYLDDSKLSSDISFYINFEIGSDDPTTNDYLTEYVVENDKISNINVTTFSNNITISIESTTTDFLSDKIQVTLNKDTSLNIGEVYSINLLVEFNYTSSEGIVYDYDFNIIAYFLVDDNYNQKLKYSYDDGDELFIQEPFVINNVNNTLDKIIDSSGNTFSGCIPNIFKTADSDDSIVQNYDFEIEDLVGYDRYYNFMDSDNISLLDDVYKKLIKSDINNVNNKFNYWELMDKVIVNNNIIVDVDNYQKIMTNINYLILVVNNKIKFFNITSKDNGFKIDYNFNKDEIGILMINVNKSVNFERKIFFNKNINIIYADFGTFNIGEVIAIGNNEKPIVLLIANYDNLYNSYVYEIISNHNNNDFKNTYESYYSLGYINNFSLKDELLYIKQKNILISRTKDQFNFGDFLYNSKSIGFYDNESIIYYDNNVNYTFHQKGVYIHLQKMDDQWVYLGSNFGSNNVIVARINNGDEIESKLLYVKFVLNHIVYWGDDYQTILENIDTTIFKVDDDYIFYKPFQPYEFMKYSEIGDNDNGIIFIDQKNYQFQDKKIIDYNGKLKNKNYYHVIKLHDVESEFSKYNYQVYPVSKTYFKNTSLYYSPNIYFDGEHSIDSDIIDLELTDTQVFFYKSSDETYLYPVYIIKQNYNDTYVELDNIYYYQTTETDTYEEITDNYALDLVDYFDNPIYIQVDGKYFYPLYLDYNKLNNSEIEDEFVSLNCQGNIETKTRKINITSIPDLSGQTGVEYNYDIVADVNDARVLGVYIPLWLTLDGYNLNGIPSSDDIDDNVIEIIVYKDNLSTKQKFTIEFIDDKSVYFTSNPTTYAYTGVNYEYNLSYNSNNVNVEAICLPLWLSLNNNKISGTPPFSCVGENNVVLKISDDTDSCNQEFSIFVEDVLCVYINTKPQLYQIIGESYEYTLGIEGVNAFDLIEKKIPDWLTLTNDNNSYSLSGTPTSEGEFNVDLEIKSCNSVIKHAFTITALNISEDMIYMTSNPLLSAFCYNKYYYKLTSNKLIFRTRLILSPDWLEIIDGNFIYGIPTLSDIGDHSIEIEIDDYKGNSFKSKFVISVFEFHNKKIKLDNGIGLNVIRNSYDYNSTIVLNKRQFTLKNIVDYGMYYEVIIKEYCDMNDEFLLELPTSINKIKTEFINDKSVTIYDNLLAYNIEMTETYDTINIFIYYIVDDTDLFQLRIFKAKDISDTSFVISDSTFSSFLENTQYFCYLENYIPISLTDISQVDEENTCMYQIKPYKISKASKILIEEKNADYVIVHIVEIKLENGLLTIDKNIENDNSNFFLNRIIPIRIKDNIIQIKNPFIVQNNVLGIRNSPPLIGWLKIPINKLDRPVLKNNKWSIKISSKYLPLIDRFETYSIISDDEIYKIDLQVSENKYYLTYDKLPNSSNKFVYCKKIKHFQYLEKIHGEFNESYEIPTNTELEQYLNNDWNKEIVKTKIPLTITEGDLPNKYTLDSDFNNSNLFSDDDVLYYLGNPNNKIINLGINSSGLIEVVTEDNILDLSNTHIFYETTTNKAIYNDKNEVFSSVLSFIDKIETKKIVNEFSLNLGKSLDDWTAITFTNRINYSAKNQLYNKYLVSDSSGNITLKDDMTNAILLYEEVYDPDKLYNVVKLLVENSFSKYYKLIKIRQIETIIFFYIKRNSINVNFWNDPIENINTFLSSYEDNSIKTSDYTIYKNCIVEVDEITDESINNTSLFRNINDSIERIAYLDNQFDLQLEENADTYDLYVARNSKHVIETIENFIEGNFNNYFYGINSHKLLQKISEIYQNKKIFFDDLRDGLNFNFNYDILTLEKILIAKHWDNVKSDYNINSLFNNDFNNNLRIDYTSRNSYDSNFNYNGLIIRSNEDLYPFGLDSYNILNLDNQTEEEGIIIYYDSIEGTHINEPDINYKLFTDNLYEYEISSSSDIIFKYDYSYTLKSLEGDRVLNSELINVDNIEPNKIKFYSNNIYNSNDDITLDVSKSYNIINNSYLGYFYKDLILGNISSTTFDLYYDTESLIIEDVELNEGYVKFNLITQNLIENEDYLRIEKLIGIKSQELIDVDGETRLYLTFSKTFTSSNIYEIGKQLYLKVESYEYQIFNDNNNYYIILDSLINMSINYYVFTYYNFFDIEDKKTNYHVNEITVDEDIENIGFKILEPLPINYKMDDVEIFDIKISNKNVIKVFTELLLDSPSNLINTFNLEKHSPIKITELNLAEYPFLIEIDNSILVVEESNTIKLQNENNEIIEGVFYKYSTGRNILFAMKNKANLSDIEEYNTIIENEINFTDFSLYSNIIEINLNDILIDFVIYDNVTYYILIDDEYQEIDNDNLYLFNNILRINLSNTDYELSTLTTIYIKQIISELKSFNSYEYNMIFDVTLEYDKYLDIDDQFKLNYIDNMYNNIGNYIYYFEDTINNFDISLNYKLENKESLDKIDIFMIGTKGNKYFFATVDEIIDVSLLEFNLYDDKYIHNIVLSGADINLSTNNLSNGIIFSVNSRNSFTVGIKTFDIINDYKIFPDLSSNANLYFNYYTRDSNITLNEGEILKYKFPDDLDYSRFYETTTNIEYIKEDIVWDEYLPYKVMEYIHFYMNDLKIDTLNEDIFKINQVYLDKDKVLSMKPFTHNQYYRIFIPLQFWFTKDNANYLPLISLCNTSLLLKLKLNKLENLISNDLENLISDLPSYFKLNLLTDTILLGENERRRFAEYNHEYIIEKNVQYNKSFIDTTEVIMNLNIRGLIKDIFWVIKSTKTNKNYISLVENKRDTVYSDFLNILSNYQDYVENDRQINEDIENFNITVFYFLDDFYENVFVDYDEYKYIEEDSFLSTYSTVFILYLYTIKLSYYDNFSDSYFSETEENVDRVRMILKFEKIKLYLKHIYIDEEKVTKIQPIKSFNFKSNGQELFARNDYIYFSSVIPVNKFNKKLEDGISVYSFSLYPTSGQPSGHLNFNVLNNSTLDIELDEMIVDEPCFLSTITKEYQILRIISGIGTLSWN